MLLVFTAQAGLPLHLHYCKGMLESVSVFFNAGCDEHGEEFEATSCCSPGKGDKCSKESMGCCEDEAAVLLQDFDSLVHYVDDWNSILPAQNEVIFTSFENGASSLHDDLHRSATDSGPPIYILFSSLIFYA